MAKNMLSHPPFLRFNIFIPNSCIFSSMSGTEGMRKDSVSTTVPLCHTFFVILSLCRCVGLQGLQPFRINLLQHGTYVSISSSQENLLQCELSASERFFNKYPVCPGVVFSKGFRELLPLSWSFFSMGSLFLVPGAPTPSSSFLTLEFLVFFLTFLLLLLTAWAMFCPFLIMLSQKHHLLYWWIQLCLQWVHWRAALTNSCWHQPCSHP